MLPSHSIETIENVPARQFVRMAEQPLVPWTPPRLMRAVLEWMITETPRAEIVQPVETRVS